MIRFGKWVVKHRSLILIIGILLLIPSAFGYFHTRVNYDILNYLPDEIDTMKGQEIMVDEFVRRRRNVRQRHLKDAEGNVQGRRREGCIMV